MAKNVVTLPNTYNFEDVAGFLATKELDFVHLVSGEGEVIDVVSKWDVERLKGFPKSGLPSVGENGEFLVGALIGTRESDKQRLEHLLIGILRYFVSNLMRTSQLPDSKIIKKGQVIIRARNLRPAANFIPPKAFRARKVYYTNEENGLLFVPKGQGQNPQAQMFSDPNMAMDLMKKNLSMIIPQTLTFAWVNFFSGFIAAKIPFPLTQRFRSMLQNGIDLSTVDVSYVSSRSWVWAVHSKLMYKSCIFFAFKLP